MINLDQLLKEYDQYRESIQVSVPIQQIFDFIRNNEGKRVAIFLHTSIVLEKKEYIDELYRKSSENIMFYLPMNCYCELLLLSKAGSISSLSDKAKHILSLPKITTSSSHKELCEMVDLVAKRYKYDVGLFAFYEPAAAIEFSRRFHQTDNNYILSYNPAGGISHIPCYYAHVDIEPRRMCKPLNNNYYAKNPDYQVLSIVNKEMQTVKTINFSSLEQVNNGTEARIYTTPELPDKYLKIYTAFKPSDCMRDKLLLLMRRYGYFKNFAVPSDLVFVDGNCVGFVMDKINAKSFRNALYSPEYESEEANRRLILNLSVTLLEARLCQLIVADLSPNNILVTDSGQVVFIDVDSMEFCCYPGGGVTEPYGHPDIDAVRDAYHRLRTFEESNFSFSVLLFFILLGWEHPLTQCGMGNNLIWRRDKFPLKNSNINQKTWVVDGASMPDDKIDLWKKQSYAIREGFVNVFNFKTTYDIGEWMICIFSDTDS